MATLCDTFRRQAGAVWSRTSGAAALHLSMSEETLTETVLYETARKHQAGEYIVVPATKQQEYLHGADWLFWFVTNGKGISYRVQAKKLFHNGRYQSLFKSGKDTNGQPVDPEIQLKKLIRSAHAGGHIPLYCFYNFRHAAGDFGHVTFNCIHSYRPPSYWGCSIALAEDVQVAQSDELGHLRKFMLPWHLLACTSQGSKLADSAAAFGRRLAEPKGEPRVVDGRLVGWERDRRDVSVELRPAPDAVVEMVEISDRDRKAEEHIRIREEIDTRAASILEEQELAGLVIFDDSDRVALDPPDNDTEVEM